MAPTDKICPEFFLYASREGSKENYKLHLTEKGFYPSKKSAVHDGEQDLAGKGLEVIAIDMASLITEFPFIYNIMNLKK